jgi:hypothetical protein
MPERAYQRIVQRRQASVRYPGYVLQNRSAIDYGSASRGAPLTGLRGLFRTEHEIAILERSTHGIGLNEAFGRIRIWSLPIKTAEI